MRSTLANNMETEDVSEEDLGKVCREEVMSSISSVDQQSSSVSVVSLGEMIAQRAQQGLESWCPLPVTEHPSSSSAHDGPVSSCQSTNLTQPGPCSTSFDLDFQDSRLSPALPLMPANVGKTFGFGEETAFQQTDMEFVALRGSPDVSVVSESFSPPFQTSETLPTRHPSLSQHPLAVSSLEDGVSICSLSQHSIMSSRPAPDNTCMDVEEELDWRGPRAGADGQHAQKTPDDLASNVSPHYLLDLIQKDVGGLSSSSAVSLASLSKTSSMEFKMLKTVSPREESPIPSVIETNCEPSVDAKLSTEFRQGPLGAALEKSKVQLDSDNPVPTQSNITVRTCEAEHEGNLDELRKQLCSEIQIKRQSRASSTEMKNTLVKPVRQSVTPNTVDVSSGSSKPEGHSSAGFSFERGHSERELSSSANHTALNGSFLASLSRPVSQSTPGVFASCPRLAMCPSLGKLSPVESNIESLLTSKPSLLLTNINTGPSVEKQDIITASLHRSEKFTSLPSLSYAEKVGAWSANQTSGKTFCDELTLHGLVGVSSKRTDFSDSLSQLESSQGKLRSPTSMPGSGLGTRSPRRNLAATFSGSAGMSPSSPKVMTPMEQQTEKKDGCSVDAAIAADEPSSPLREGPHITLRDAQAECSFSQDITPRSLHQRDAEAGNTNKPKAGAELPVMTLTTLGGFSDVSSCTLTSSQCSHTRAKLSSSPGAVSSVVSLEVDNYAPYWISNPTTPAKDKELNIEDRIPAYLRNLGIDQSPSSILTPFVSRGPIREAEFSPTDLCTIRGSTQPSEGGTSEKGEFSRSSFVSLASSLSIPLSVESLQSQHTGGKSTLDRPVSQCSRNAVQHADLSGISQASHDPDVVFKFAVTNKKHMLAQVSTIERQVVHSRDFPDTQKGLSAASLGRSSSSKPLQEIQKLLMPRSASSCESSITSNQMLKSFHDTSQSSITSNQKLDSFQDSSKCSISSRKLGSFQESFASSTTPKQKKLESFVDTSDSCSTSKQNKLEGFDDSSESTQKKDFIRSSAQSNRDTLMSGTTSSESLLFLNRLRKSFSSEYLNSSAQGAVGSKGKAEVSVSLQNISTQTTIPDSAKVARRSEPEGCSAALPDTVTPVFVSVTQPQEVESPSGSPLSADMEIRPHTEMATESDGSTVDSLAFRVANLLQVESPATVGSSRPSSAEEKEQREREWMQLQARAPLCDPLRDPLVLSVQDRQHIEEIKKELLLTAKSEPSSDTDSSSSVHCGKAQLPAQWRTESTSLEARVRQIAHREGLLTSPALDQSLSTPAGQQSVTTPALESEAQLDTGCVFGKTESAPLKVASPCHDDPIQGEDDTFRNLMMKRSVNAHYRSASVLQPDVQSRGVLSGQWKELTPACSPPSVACSSPSMESSRTPVKIKSPLSSPNKKVLSHLHHSTSATTSSTHVGSPEENHPDLHAEESKPYGSHFPDISGRDLSGPALAVVGLQEENGPIREHYGGTANVSTESSWRSNCSLQSYRTLPNDVSRQTRTFPSLQTQTAAVPVLLPYKPRGSPELFYMPQTEAPISPSQSDTTVDISHTGSTAEQDSYKRRDGEKHTGSSMNIRDTLDSQRFREDAHQSRVTLGMAQSYDQREGRSQRPEGGASLDDLWKKFNERGRQEGACPNTGEEEPSILERLEELARRIRSSGVSKDSVWEGPQSSTHRGSTHRGSAPLNSSLRQQRCPAERDESESTETSSIDTARLIRAFGPRRVRSTQMGLDRLYANISKQQRSSRRKPNTADDLPQQVATDSVSSSSTRTSSSPSPHSHSLLVNKPVKHANKGVQAGDLEIVSNATRKHTRDVGTTFPSPASVCVQEVKSRRHPAVCYPQGVSWFVPAECKKENRALINNTAAPVLGCSESYRTASVCREPLRELYLQDETDISQGRGLAQPISNKEMSAKQHLLHLTLQEALQLRRPDFISRSRERVKRLGLQVEERRLQSLFACERYQLFNRPLTHHYTGRPEKIKRVVPRKEMFLRSKQMYAQLPEVKRKREEEKRKAEYRSYRLRAQLYKTKITNRVLGRRTAWQ